VQCSGHGLCEPQEGKECLCNRGWITTDAGTGVFCDKSDESMSLGGTGNKSDGLPKTICVDDNLPFSTASGGTVCIPRHIYPSPEAQHCVFGKTWKDVIRNRDLFATGGLGKKMRDGWEVWVCAVAHPCVERKGDWACFTYFERHEVFVPWGFNSALNVMPKTTSTSKVCACLCTCYASMCTF